MSVLSTDNLIYEYSKGTPFETDALKGISLSFEKGEIVALIGHTGSGKSTLLQMFNGLLKPDTGTVYFNGEDIRTSKSTLKNSRFKIGLCFQYPEQQLFESTVRRDISFGPRNMKLPEDVIEQRVDEACALLEINRDYLEKSPFDLSGGEKRRVAIAGVTAMQPEVLILDEPGAGLDPAGKKMLLKFITDYNKKTGNTVIFVTHNMDDAALIADRVIVMDHGSIFMSGTVSEVFSKASELRSVGLDVPEITSLFIKLRESGLDISENVYTVEDAVKALLDHAGRRNNG